METEIVKTKQFRKSIDEIVQSVETELTKGQTSEIAVIKLKEAVMWLGLHLKELGAQNPYPHSKNPETGDIVDPTADGLKF
jgi:hypothetical protein